MVTETRTTVGPRNLRVQSRTIATSIPISGMPNLEHTDDEHPPLLRLVKKTLVAVHPNEGPLTERRAVVPPARRERVLMPETVGKRVG